MVNFFIFRGVCGHPKENWFDWLKTKLESLGHDVFIPQFPTPENQTLNKWLEILEGYKQHINEETILIGHSLGVPFTLNVIELHKVRAAFLVAGYTGIAGNQFDESMKTFTQRKFNWEKIKGHCKIFQIFNADNDPFVPVEKGEELAKNLETNMILVKGAGHINTPAGYTQFELLLENIKETISHN
jgi:uncharacterized protein